MKKALAVMMALASLTPSVGDPRPARAKPTRPTAEQRERKKRRKAARTARKRG